MEKQITIDKLTYFLVIVLDFSVVDGNIYSEKNH